MLTQGPLGIPNSACLRLNRTLSLECPVGTGLHQFPRKQIMVSLRVSLLMKTDWSSLLGPKLSQSEAQDDLVL